MISAVSCRISSGFPSSSTLSMLHSGSNKASNQSQAPRSEERLLEQLNSVYNDLRKSSTPYQVQGQQHTFVKPSFDENDSGSVNPNKRKSVEEEGNDKKKKKRYTWSDDLHRKFMASIFDIGLSHAKPKVLLNLLQPAPEGLTTEHIKSHLQKYRQNCQKTKKLFLAQYEIAKDQSQRSYRGKALNPGHHAYPFVPGPTGFKMDFDLKAEVENQIPAVQQRVVPEISPRIVGSAGIVPSSHVGNSGGQPQGIMLNRHSHEKYGPGKVVFIPDSFNIGNPLLSPPSTMPGSPNTGSTVSGNSRIVNRRKSQASDFDFEEYTKRMEEQLSTQQIIQAQRSRLATAPQQHQNSFQQPSQVVHQQRKRENFVLPAVNDAGEFPMSPNLGPQMSSDNLSLSFLDNASAGDWGSLADAFDDSRMESVDQVFKFLDDE